MLSILNLEILYTSLESSGHKPSHCIFEEEKIFRASCKASEFWGRLWTDFLDDPRLCHTRQKSTCWSQRIHKNITKPGRHFTYIFHAKAVVKYLHDVEDLDMSAYFPANPTIQSKK